MDNNEAFERFDKEHFGKKDMPINYEEFEAPLIGVRYVDAFVQSRFEYYQAAQQQSAGEIAELKADNKTLVTVNNKMAGEIVALKADNERLREALEIAKISSCSCLTKTHEHVYHDKNCRYRIYCEALSATRPQSLQAHDNER